jgi:ribose/xylose/arabinose/galactoside ABC-type transport system permease subunit
VLALTLLLVTVGLSNPRFLAERNLLDILQGNAYIVVAASACRWSSLPATSTSRWGL